MAYKKYIKRKGKVYGPYIYHSRKVKGKVITEYLGKEKKKTDKKKNKTIIFLILGLLFLFSLIFMISNRDNFSANFTDTFSKIISPITKSLTGLVVSGNDTEINQSEIVEEPSGENETISKEPIPNKTTEILNETLTNNETSVNKTVTVNDTFVNETNITEQIPENITEINITEANATIITTQYQAVLGQPVKWKKQVSLDEPRKTKIKLPKEAENINVSSVAEKQSARFSITGAAISEKSGKPFLLKLFRKIFGAITGRAVQGTAPQEKEVEIDDTATEYEIEYETPAPYAIEEDIEKGKRVKIVGPENLHYENVLAFTGIPESSKNAIKLYRTTDGVKEQVQITNYEDTNENGLIDYIEWIVPQLSNQTYEIIIEITKAEHLDSNRQFISDIYNEVKELDDIWSEEIPSEDYIRVTFEQELDNTRDITIYPRIVSGNPKIEVYEIDGTEILAEFSSINSNEYNKIYLTNLIGEQDTFDLRVVGGSLEFDYIVDPVGEQLDNPSFTGGSTSWTLDVATYDSAVYQDSAGSMKVEALQRENIDGYSTQDGYDSYISGDSVDFSCYYRFDTTGGTGQFYAQIANSLTPTTWVTIYDSGSLSTSVSWTSTGVQDVSSSFDTGSYRLRLWQYITAANKESSQGYFDNCSLYRSIAVDTTPPTIQVQSPTNTSYSTSTIWFNATADESIDTWIVNYNETNITHTINNSLEVEDGNYHLLLYANDSANNFGLNDSIYFTVDKTAPTVTLPVYINATEKKLSDYLTLNILVSDITTNPESCSVYVTGQLSNQTIAYSNGWCNTTTFSLTDANEGNSTIYVYANDTVGNWGLNDSYVVWIDATAPTITLPVYANATQKKNTDSLTYNISVSDAGVGASYCSINVADSANQTLAVNNGWCNGTYDLTGIGDGNKTINAYANDTLGNTALNNSYVVWLDSTAPIITVISPLNQNYTTITVDFNVSLDENADWCGFSLDEAANVTMTKFNDTYFNYTNSSMTQGNHNVVYSCNDTFGNMNASSETVSFTVDSIGPTINTEASNETEINQNEVFCLNITATDSAGVDTVYAEVWNTASWANYTMSDTGSTSCDVDSGDGVYGVEIQGTAQGIWNYSKAYANDTLNNWDSYEFAADLTINVTAPADSAYPQFTNFQEYLSNDSDYSFGQSYQFNSTITFTNGTVYLSFDGANYSATNISDEFYVDIASLAADTYNYYWWGYGNGSQNNYNSSATRAYVVQKATPVLTKYLNGDGDLSITYPQEVNASASTTAGTVNIYRNSTEDVTSENNIYISLSAGYYEYEFNVTGNTNYTDLSSVFLYATISKATGIVYAYIDNQQDNKSVLLNTEKWLNATLITPGSGNIELWYDNTKINQGTSPLYNLTNFTQEGKFNVSGIYSGNENYTSDIETWWVTVSTDSTPTINIVYPDNIIYNVNVSILNYTVDDDINLSHCWYSLNEGETNSSPDATCSNYTDLTSNEGSNTWTVYANDSIGQENSDWVTFTKDTTYPTFSGYAREPLTPNEDQSVQVNVTITENNLDDVILEWNATTNYTVTTSNENEYYFTITSGNYTAHDSVTYYWYANDTAGNMNKSAQQFFTVANQIPTITVNEPDGTNDNTKTTFNVTWSASDNDAEDTLTISCYGDLDNSGYDKTYTCFTETEDDGSESCDVSSWSENTYYIWCNATDTYNSTLDYSPGELTVDITNPSITNLVESPTDPTWTSGATYQFNATITDTNLDKVLIEFDNVNYTPTKTGDVYNLTLNDLAADTYNYYWYANDSAGNVNQTSDSYTINNASGDITLLINGSASDQTAPYKTQTNASATTSYGSVTLYRNETPITSENNVYVTLAANYYNYTAYSSGDQNHSSASITRFVEITKAQSEVNLTLNETDGNVTISQGTEILLNGTLITGDNSGTLELYKAGNLINQGTIEVSNSTNFPNVGLLNITVFYIESQNYTDSYETWWVNVTEAPDEEAPSVSSLTERPEEPVNYSEGATYEFNATVTDNIALDTVLLDFNGINYSATNLTTNLYNVTLSDLSVGTYDYRWYANDTSENMNSTENGTYTISQATPSLSLTITPSTSETYGTQTTATGSDCPAQLICKLYRNDTGEITSPDIATLGVGIYNYTYNTTENANYTGASVSDILIINKTTSEVNLTLNGTDGNVTINQYSTIWLNGTLITGQEGENIKLYNNGTLINQGPSPRSNLTTFSSVGLFNITTIYDGNTNYTSAYETWWVDVLEIDITKPNITINFPLAQNYSTNSITFNVTAEDNSDVSSCWYSLDSGVTNYSMTETNPPEWDNTNSSMTQGWHTANFYCNDTSNNLNDTEQVTFFIDSIDPIIQFVPFTETSGTSLGRNYIQVNVTASDTNLANITIRLYNSTSNLIKTNISSTSPFPINYTGLTAGTYFFNATANDTLGNNISTETRNISLVLPELTIIKPENETYIHTKNLLLNYIADYEDFVWYNINQTDNLTISENTTFNTTQGQHTLYLYANNTLGETARNITFSVDINKFVVIYDKFKDEGESTDFNQSSYKDLQNLSGIVLENTEYGKISLNDPINLTDDANASDNEVDLNTYTNISSNHIEINSTALPNFNKSATLYFYGLSSDSKKALRNEEECSSEICTTPALSAGTWSFNITQFTSYSLEDIVGEEAPSGEPIAPSRGGGRSYECYKDSDCEEEDQVCLNHKCVKPFDIKIINFESPAKLGEFFDFTYLIKGMADISGDVEVSFWIERKKETITSGSDVIYLGSFEEKIETTKIFLPTTIDSGVYQFFVQVKYENYTVQSHRTIEIEVKDGFAEITPIDRKIRKYSYYLLGLILLAILIMLIRIARKKNWMDSIKDWKKRRDLQKLLETEKDLVKKRKIKLNKKIEKLKRKILNFIKGLIISLKKVKRKEKKPEPLYKPKRLPEKLEVPEPEIKHEPEIPEHLHILKKEFAEDVVEEVKKEEQELPTPVKTPKQIEKIPAIKKIQITEKPKEPMYKPVTEIKEKPEEELYTPVTKTDTEKSYKDIIEDMVEKEQSKKEEKK